LSWVWSLFLDEGLGPQYIEFTQPLKDQLKGAFGGLAYEKECPIEFQNGKIRLTKSDYSSRRQLLSKNFLEKLAQACKLVASFRTFIHRLEVKEEPSPSRTVGALLFALMRIKPGLILSLFA
jgi:hypothetical protein